MRGYSRLPLPYPIGEDERRALLERFAVALRDAGLEPEDRGDGLYVAPAE